MTLITYCVPGTPCAVGTTPRGMPIAHGAHSLEELVRLSLETSAGVVARAFCMLLARLFEMGWEREKKRKGLFLMPEVTLPF